MRREGEGLAQLSGKERECLRLVGENRSSKEVARLLGISPTSVDTYVRRALTKLGVRDRHVAAEMLARWEAPRAEGEITIPTVGAPAAAPPLAALLAGLAPPLGQLPFLARLRLVLAAAAIEAVVFGVLLNALRAL